MAARQYLLDRLRGIVPPGLKWRLFRTITQSGLLRRIALGRDGMVRSAGLRFDCSGGYEIHAAAIRVGLYERAERFMASHFIAGDRAVVELGSSIGVISCEVARRLEPGSRLICVEADPRLAERAERNLRLNGFTGAVVERAAVDYSGVAEIGFVGGASLGGHVGASSLTVPTVTLSGLLERHAIGDFDLVMDIEGSELDLFIHDGAALARCRRILIEFDTMEGDGAGQIRHVTALGFQPIYRHASCAVFERKSAAPHA